MKQALVFLLLDMQRLKSVREFFKMKPKHTSAVSAIFAPRCSSMLEFVTQKLDD
jgi:hypothetical protein